MKIEPLHPSSTFGLDPSSTTPEAQAKVGTGQIDGKEPIDPEKLRLAREFEQIFIRKMLSSLEKSGQKPGAPASSAAGNAYGSMVVSALAEAVSKGGGIGLAEVIARAASQPSAGGPSSSSASTAAIQATIANAAAPTTATYSRPRPAIIINENNDLRDSFKDPNR